MRYLKICRIAAVAAWFCAGAVAYAQTNYGLDVWAEDVKDTRWESGATVAGVTALGMYSWDWGSSKRFRWNPEGWFGANTGSGGADKLGHAFTSYALTNVLADRLVRQGKPAERAALSAALTTQAIMLYVEVFDGYSNDHGFAREDVVMNMLGTGLAYARTVNPALRDVLDYRMEYQPSGYKGFRPFSDYEAKSICWRSSWEALTFYVTRHCAIWSCSWAMTHVVLPKRLQPQGLSAGVRRLWGWVSI